MRKISLLLFLFNSFATYSQDVTGTWEGELSIGVYSVPKIHKMKWELIHIEREVYGIVYIYPQDTKAGDEPNVVYTWYGKQGKTKNFPFQFIIGKYIDGLGSSQVYQFNVGYNRSDSTESLNGKWFNQLETLETLDKGRGLFMMKKISDKVSDKLWLKRKEKEIIEKLEKSSSLNSQ